MGKRNSRDITPIIKRYTKMIGLAETRRHPTHSRPVSQTFLSACVSGTKNDLKRHGCGPSKSIHYATEEDPLMALSRSLPLPNIPLPPLLPGAVAPPRKTLLLAGNGSGRPRSLPLEWKMSGRYSPSFSIRDEFWKREIIEALP